MVVISLGTNLGNRHENLKKAIELLDQRCLKNIRQSIVLETEAILPEGAPADWNIPYLDMIVTGNTHLSPQELLSELKKIEREIGRPEIYDRWSPRIIDLDILFYNDINIQEENLVIPHREINNRPFFLHLLSLMDIHKSYNPEWEKSFTKCYTLYPQFVGIVNITQDSFSDGGKYYDIDNAVKQIEKLNKDGAAIIELGAQVTNQNAKILPHQKELEKLNQVLKEISPLIEKEKIKISLDTFRPEIALSLLEKYNISMINDVKGDFNKDTLRIIAESNCQFCRVHSLTIPVNKFTNIPEQSDLISYLLNWGTETLDKLCAAGFSRDRIILDPGIGFGKNSKQSIHILRNIDKFHKWNCCLMVGHSRKSYIQAFSNNPAAERDLETIVISQMLSNKIDFIRVHEVEKHMRALVTQKVLYK